LLNFAADHPKIFERFYAMEHSAKKTQRADDRLLCMTAQLRLSCAHSLFSNDYGFQGQGFRLMLVDGF
jgi:hypothetical protein